MKPDIGEVMPSPRGDVGPRGGPTRGVAPSVRRRTPTSLFQGTQLYSLKPRRRGAPKHRSKPTYRLFVFASHVPAAQGDVADAVSEASVVYLMVRDCENQD